MFAGGTLYIKNKIYHYLKNIFIFFRTVLIKFYRDRCIIRASGMAYSSLLALVPLTALVFSLLTAFGVFDRLRSVIQQFVVEQLLPTRQGEIISYINIFVENTKTLGVAGLLLFTVTSVLLISNIQSNFNDIWKTEKKLGFISRFSVYTSVIMISTMLVGSGFAVTGWIQRKASSLFYPDLNRIFQLFIFVSPKILFSFSLFILILAVPSVPVKGKNAFAGAVFGGFLMWVVKKVFAAWSNNAIRFSLVYGSIALIPIFLIWLYILWIVILFSVEISYVMQTGWRNKKKDEHKSVFETFREIFEVYLFICTRYLENSGGTEVSDIQIFRDEDGFDAEAAAGELVKNGLILRIDNGNYSFVPSTPPHSTLIIDVIKKITGVSTAAGSSVYEHVYREIVPALINSRRNGENITVSCLLEQNIKRD